MAAIIPVQEKIRRVFSSIDDRRHRLSNFIEEVKQMLAENKRICTEEYKNEMARLTEFTRGQNAASDFRLKELSDSNAALREALESKDRALREIIESGSTISADTFLSLPPGILPSSTGRRGAPSLRLPGRQTRHYPLEPTVARGRSRQQQSELEKYVEEL
jgi:hypothetical protein